MGATAQLGWSWTNHLMDHHFPLTWISLGQQQAAGWDFLIIGRRVVTARGTIQVYCDCSWTFSGSFLPRRDLTLYGQNGYGDRCAGKIVGTGGADLR